LSAALRLIAFGWNTVVPDSVINRSAIGTVGASLLAIHYRKVIASKLAPKIAYLDCWKLGFELLA
jgi:hypothetical protein